MMERKRAGERDRSWGEELEGDDKVTVVTGGLPDQLRFKGEKRDS